MHTGDKIAESAMGCLTRSNGKSGDGLSKAQRVINPFPEGQALKKLAHDTAKHFRTDSRRQKMYDVARLINMVYPILLAFDFNTTRVAAVRLLIFSVLRMYPVLIAYAMKYPGKLVISQVQWLDFAQADAILTLMSTLTTLAQTEKLIVGVYGIVVLLELHTRLWAPTMQGGSLFHLHNSIHALPHPHHSLLLLLRLVRARSLALLLSSYPTRPRSLQ